MLLCSVITNQPLITNQSLNDVTCGKATLPGQLAINVVGAGLAGSECAYQLAERGYRVRLHEMKPQKFSPAHRSDQFGELVCSNSFGSQSNHSAPGQLKWEAEQMNSFVLRMARRFSVPAGQALGVDRERFSLAITQELEAHPNIEIIRGEVRSLDLPRPLVLATGPLTSDDLASELKSHFGEEFLYFFDAIAPIIDADSINKQIVFRADRWDLGTGDYLNCPLRRKDYLFLIDLIREARKIEPKEFEKTPYFESCMPVEAILERGDQTLRFGPMSPKGLRDPRTGRSPYAVVQLRQENAEATAYNMVGFQTKMAYPEQTRVFRCIPGLEEAEFLKLGSIHRNLYINSTVKLNQDLSSRKDPFLFLAGQITGVEGYFESTCIGLLIAELLHQKLSGGEFVPPPRESAFGSLLYALVGEEKKHFQPTNINFGLLPGVEEAAVIEWSKQNDKTREEPLPKKEIRRNFKEAKRDFQLARAKEAFLAWTRKISKLRGESLTTETSRSVEHAT